MPYKKLPVLAAVLLFSIYAKHEATTYAKERDLFKKTLTPQAKAELQPGTALNNQAQEVSISIDVVSGRN